MISRMCESLASRLALALDEPEREAVLGDLAESCAGGWKAVLDIFGLGMVDRNHIEKNIGILLTQK